MGIKKNRRLYLLLEVLIYFIIISLIIMFAWFI